MLSGPEAAGRLCVSVGAPQRPRNPSLLPLRLPGNRGDPTRRVYAPCSLLSSPGAAEISNFCYENALMFMGASEWPCTSVQAAQRLQYLHCCPCDYLATVATVRSASTRRAACRALPELLKPPVSVTKPRNSVPSDKRHRVQRSVVRI